MNASIGDLRSAFRYDCDTGVVSRIGVNGWRELKPSISSNEYDRIGFQYKRYGAHRLIWALVTGAWPEFDIDHKNGNRSDNRLCNLRHVDRSTNLENIKVAKSNNKSTGVLGVHVSQKGLITSRIRVRGKGMYLGAFPSVQEAHAAYLDAKRQHHQGSLL